MAVTVFILGRPGSGKSSAARRIVKLARRSERIATRVNDYDILQEMFLSDQKGEKFHATDHGGFEVRDFSVLDTVLQKAEQMARTRERSADIVIIEFARDDYDKALKQFNKAFLKHAYFLFLNTNVETCIQRIHSRITNPTTPDDHYVAPHILKLYYHNQRIPSDLTSEHGIDAERVICINNNGSRDSFNKNINRFVNFIFEREIQLQLHRGVLLNLAWAINIFRRPLRSTAKI